MEIFFLFVLSTYKEDQKQMLKIAFVNKYTLQKVMYYQICSEKILRVSPVYTFLKSKLKTITV